MNRTLTVLLLIAGVCVSPIAAQETKSRSAAEEEVRQLEREWLDAYEQYNAEAMDRIVADDFVITFPNGKLQTKPQLMAMIKRPRREGAPAKRFYTEGVESRVYGDDMVILRGRVIEESQQDGKPVKEESRYTDVYVNTNGRWQVVASHLSALAVEAKR